MKRNLDLARNILLAIENDEEATGRGLVSLCIDDGYSQEEVAYHVKLLHEAGLIEAIDRSGGIHLRWDPQSLTWYGHEFLDSARNENIWEKGKKLAEKVGNSSFQMVLETLLKLAKDQLSS